MMNNPSDFVIENGVLIKYNGTDTAVTVPDGVTVIGERAFYNCRSLQKVTLPEGLTSIGSGAFACTDVRSVMLPSSVHSIANDSFTYMTMGRQKVGRPYETPAELKVKKDHPHYYTDGKCLYERSGDDLTLVLCYKGSISALDVATGTVRIKSGAFAYCKYLKSVTLPDTLVKLDEGVFKGLELSALHLPANTTDIGESDFAYLIDNLSSWNDYYGTGSIWSTEIVVEEGNPVYASGRNCFIKKEDGKATLLRVFDKRKNIIGIPEYVTHIGSRAFEGCGKIKTLKLPERLVAVSSNAFKKCTSLEEITLPASTEILEADAFADCKKLRYVVFEGNGINIDKNAFSGCRKAQLVFSCPSGSTAEAFAKNHGFILEDTGKDAEEPSASFSYSIQKDKTVKITAYISRDSKAVIPGTIEGLPVTAFQKDIFRNNNKLTSVVWPMEIPVIPSGLFWGCYALKEVVLPEGLTTISEEAFRNCTSLKEISIPESVAFIHEKAFECARKTDGEWVYWNSVRYIHGAKGSYAERFAKTEHMDFIPFNSSEQDLEAFRSYSFHEVADGIALDDFVITKDVPKTKPLFDDPYLQRFDIPNEILGKPVVELSPDFHKSKKQSQYSVNKYDNIAETLVIPKNLKRIRCPLAGRGIINITVSPENHEVVFDHYAWYEDGGKKVVAAWINSHFSGPNDYTIKDGAVRASREVDQAFRLDKLTFPDSFTEVFEGFLTSDWKTGRDSHVEKIYAGSDSCMREYAAKIKAEFIALDRQDVVFSEDGSVLISCPQLFPDPVYTVPEHTRAIEKNAFHGNETIREIIIPDSVETIGNEAFSGCTALESVTLPASLSVLPEMAFMDCAGLKYVQWPKNLLHIGRKCFMNTAPERVRLPDTVVTVGDHAFAGQYHQSIRSVEFPVSVCRLGVSVCAGVKEITVYDSIDPDAKPAKEHYTDQYTSWNSELGCAGYKFRLGYDSFSRHTITVKSAKDGSVKYKVLMYGPEEPLNVCNAMVSSWGRNAEFRFSTIDEKFSKLKNAENRLETVVNRLTYPIDLTDDAKEKYCGWLKRNGTAAAKSLIEKDDLAGLRCLEQYGIISKKNIMELIDLAVGRKNVEISAYLLELKTIL